MKFNKERWEELKGKLFREETKAFLDFEIQSLRTKRAKNGTKMDKLYSDFGNGIVTGDFVKSRMEKISERQEEIKVRLTELEEDIKSYDDKIGKSIQIIDSMSDFKEKWEKANDEKKNEMLRLITIKIFATYLKATVRGKEYKWKDLNFVWNEEFNELFELGIIEKYERMKEIDGSSISVNNLFNGKKIRDG